MQNYDEYGDIVENDFGTILNKTFMWMFIGLLVTAGVSYFVAGNEAILNIIYGNRIMFYGLIIGELAFVVYISARIMKISKEQAVTLFLLYAALNGVTLSYIFKLYTAQSITNTFLITAGVFGIMSFYRYVTKTDLSSKGRIFGFGLIALIIGYVVNRFIGSSSFEMILTYVGIILFLGLTAWDVQKIKTIYSQIKNENVAVLGALTLYLDFINLFVRLLRIYGRRND